MGQDRKKKKKKGKKLTHSLSDSRDGRVHTPKYIYCITTLPIIQLLPCPAMRFLPIFLPAQDCDFCSEDKDGMYSTCLLPVRIDPRGWYSTWLVGFSMAKAGESDAGHAWGGSLGVLIWTTFAHPMPPQAQDQ